VTATAWLDRPDGALAVARQSLGVDTNSAVNRAYYAMFYAARSALIAIGQPDRAAGKTHSGIIAAFDEHLVLPGLIDAAHGRSFGRIEHDRLVADYLGEGIDLPTAVAAVERADAFVTAVRSWSSAAGR
jgi:uncharacterized protein (UPF0332 family)